MLFFYLNFFSVLLDCCLSQSIVPPGYEMTITNNYGYSNFHHLSPSDSYGTIELRFGVMAKSDAHIAFTPSPLAVNPLYEIVIGGDGNNHTALRRSIKHDNVEVENTPYVLSDEFFRHFRISIRINGEIQIWKDGAKKPLLKWKDPNPFPVHYYSFCSWEKIVVKWIFKPNKLPEILNSSGRADSSNVNSIRFHDGEDKLQTNLLQNYNKDVQPSSNHGTPIIVILGFSLTHFELNELTSTMILHARFRLTWRDERLKWNASDYQDISSIYIPSYIFIPSYSIWQPAISFYNNANQDGILRFGESKVVIYEEGFVLHTPPVIILEAFCDLNMGNWPFDSQSCSFEFGSRSFGDPGRIEYELIANQIDKKSCKRNLQWDLVSITTNTTVKPNASIEDENASTISLNIVIKRQIPFYRATIITPLVVIALLTIGSFLLPPNASEKILIGVVNLLILSIYLLYFSTMLPPVGNHMPFIVSVFSNTLVLVAVSIILAIFSITLSRMSAINGSPPSFLKDILVGRTGTFLGLGHLIPLVNKLDADPISSNRTSTRTDELEMAPSEGGSLQAIIPPDRNASHRLNAVQNKLDWFVVACAMDRLAFLIYVVVIPLTMVLSFVEFN